jgi:tRNA nucleotidyltransferase (CCA-adding enzyme)
VGSPSEPERRFSEDALRILRALRFASVLDFEIDADTSRALFSEAYRLADVSAERILVELRKLVGGAGAYRIIREYERILLPLLRGVDKISLPEPDSFLNMTPDERMISLFCLSADDPAAAYSDTMLALRSDRRTERFGTAVLTVMSLDLSGDGLYEAILDFGRDVVSSALSVGSRLSRATDANDRFAELTEAGAPTSIAELAIGGKEVIALGYSGAEVGILLRKLTIAAMSGKVENTSDSLIEYIKNAPLA